MAQNKQQEIDNLQEISETTKVIESEYALLRIFKSFDFHKKLPREITYPSYSGALIHQYFESKIVSEMMLEQNIGQNKVPVNIHVKLRKFPCGLISLDIADTIGQHQVNIEGTLKKVSLDSEGNELDEEVIKIVFNTFIEKQMHSLHASHPHDQSAFVSLETIKKQVENKQGCALKGQFSINQVPGNFHISLHAFGGILQTLQQNNIMPDIDLSHDIISLSFGDDQTNKLIKKKFNKGLINPLDNTEFLTPEGATGFHYIYFLNIVPTYYRESSRKNLQSYQFIATKGSYSTNHMPVIIFKYEFAGVSVQYEFEQKLLLHLIVSLCGIIGGIFILAGLLEFFNNKLLCMEFKKQTEPIIQK